MPTFDFPAEYTPPGASAGNAVASPKRYRCLALGSDGDLQLDGARLARHALTVDAIRQAVVVRLRTFRGEWFLDESTGLPYFRSILVKNPNTNLVRSLYRDALLTTPGVRSVESLELALDRGTRTLRVRFAATTDLGALTGEVGSTL